MGEGNEGKSRFVDIEKCLCPAASDNLPSFLEKGGENTGALFRASWLSTLASISKSGIWICRFSLEHVLSAI